MGRGKAFYSNKFMNILLLGMMGSGKSTVANLISQKLNLPIIYMDKEILKRTGFTSASEIYEHKMSLWKETEITLSKEYSKKDGQIIVCTASVLDNELNIIHFEENTHNLKSIYLKANPTTLLKRILEKSPDALQKTDSQKAELLESIQEIFDRRDSYFEYYTDITIETDKLDAQNTANKILATI
jgi:shikimate kinase